MYFLMVYLLYISLANILNYRVIWVHWDGMHNNTKLAACSLSRALSDVFRHMIDGLWFSVIR